MSQTCRRDWEEEEEEFTWDCKRNETKTHLSPTRALTRGCSTPGGSWEKGHLEPRLHSGTAARRGQLRGATSKRWEDWKSSSGMTYQRSKCKKGDGGTEHHSS